MENEESHKPRIAIVDANTLSGLGLKNILQDVMPMLEADTFQHFYDLSASNPDEYVHYFASVNIVLSHRAFFMQRRRKTIVLTTAADPSTQLSGFHSLCVSLPEKQLLKSILTLLQTAHSHGRNLPPPPPQSNDKILSDREIEVMTLIVHGLINKEIADKLNIGLSTVITHRRNIMEKLKVRSVSALTIYAVTHGYVDINSI